LNLNPLRAPPKAAPALFFAVPSAGELC